MDGAASEGPQSTERPDYRANRMKRDAPGRIAWHSNALKWYTYCTVALATLVFLATMLQSFTVVRSFRATDQLVQDLAHAVVREHLAFCAQLAAAQRTSALAISAKPPGDIGAALPCAAEAQRRPGQVSMTANHTAGTAAPTGSAQDEPDSAVADIHRSSHSVKRELWQRRSYALILLTSNLDILFFAVAFGLVAFYISVMSRARDSVVRARRAVATGEQHRASFLAAAGHDLRQPIQAIELFLSTLRNRPLDADARVIVSKVEAATGSMKRMISGLLDAAKLDAGMIATDCFDVELDKLLSSIKGDFEPLAGAKGLRLSIEPTAIVVQDGPPCCSTASCAIFSATRSATRCPA